MDHARCCKIDAQFSLDFQALAPIIAASYEDPSSAAAQDTIAALGCNPIGMPGGREAGRARNFLCWLEGVIARVSPASSAPCNLEWIEIGVSNTLGCEEFACMAAQLTCQPGVILNLF